MAAELDPMRWMLADTEQPGPAVFLEAPVQDEKPAELPVETVDLPDTKLLVPEVQTPVEKAPAKAAKR